MITPQDKQVLDLMLKYQDSFFTPCHIASTLDLPQATVRRIIRKYYRVGAIYKKSQPYHVKEPEYFTNPFLFERYINMLKAEKRKLQILVAQKTRRLKERGVEIES